MRAMQGEGEEGFTSYNVSLSFVFLFFDHHCRMVRNVELLVFTAPPASCAAAVI